MRFALLLLLLALGQPIFAADDDENSFPLDRTVVLNVKDKTRAETLKEAFAQAGIHLEFDHPALVNSERVLNEKFTRDFGESTVREVMLSLLDYPRTEGTYVIPDGDGWVLTSMSVFKSRRDQFLPDWLRSDRNAHPMLNHRGEVYEMTIIGSADETVFKRLHELPSLRKLSISALLNPGPLRHLSKVASLEELEIHGDVFHGERIGDAAIDAIVALPSLRSLRLSETGASDEGIQRLAAFPALRELSVYQENFLTNASLKAIGSLHQLKALSLITYVGNAKQGTAKFSQEGYRALYGMPNLERLDLVHAFQPPVIADLRFPRLKSIYLDGKPANDEAAASLAAIPTLRQLQLERDALSDAGLRQLSTNPAIRRLSFNGQNVSPAGFAALQELPNLEELSFTVAPTDAILQQVANIRSLKRLKLAARPETRSTMPSAHALHTLGTLPRLSSLELNGKVEESGLAALSDLKQLNSLSLHLEGLTQQRLDQLRNDLPNVRITATRPFFGGGFNMEPPLR
ncbi:hypothetical protein AYO47_03735 [Planctomyces sp. SCGC AG-212-M04]|nr:hypothetical protein AYO47_03735 [Planctomyces sp. SCGC AG-212-M04]